jgi:hypothetical protein
MNKAMFKLLRRMSNCGRPIEESRIKEEVLRNCKRERQGLCTEEIVEKGLNIYEKQGIKVTSLINHAINQGFISIHSDNGNSRNCMITSEGIEFLMNAYTNNFSNDFRRFENKLEEKIKDLGELPLSPMYVASLYWNGKSFKYISEDYFQMSNYNKTILDYHNYLLQLSGVESLEGKKLFHFHPKLFLPLEWMDEEISLEIEGINTPENMILLKPYPNKRYVVAGLKNGREKTSAGFYPIITDPQSFPKTVDINLTWSVGGKLKVIHHLYIDFETKDYKGDFYSSQQHVSRDSNLDSFNLTTFIEDDDEFWRGRNPAFFFSNMYGELVIEENVTLTNFPMHLHSSFHGDRHFQKWLETNKTS